MTKKNFSLLSIVGIALICVTSILGQNEANIAELKGNIQTLQQIVSDPNITDKAKEEYQGILLEKRAQLHSLLKLQLKKLQEQRTQARAEDIASIDSQIQNVSSAITQLLNSGNITATPRVDTDIQTGATTGNNPQPVSGNQPLAVNPTPVPVVAPTPAPSTSTTTQQTSDENITSIEKNYEVQLDAVTSIIQGRKVSNVPTAQANRSFELTDLPLLIPLALTAPISDKPGATVAEFVAEVENSRGDKQVGSNSNSSGTTSLVTKGAVPAIFGFAVENGAIERSQSGTSITFRGNPVGIIEMLARKGYITGYQDDSQFDRVLRNFAFGLTFDTSRGNTNGVFTGDRQQLSAFSFRYNFVNQRDPRDAKYTMLWEDLVNNQSIPVVQALGVIVRSLLADRRRTPEPFKKWLEETENLLAAANPNEVEAVLRRQLDILRTISLPAEVANALISFETNYTSFLDRRDKIIKQISKGWLVTAEYTNDRPVGMPSISNFNFIIEKGAFNGSLDLTANASFSFFNSKPAGVNNDRLRDFHFSGQLDVPLGNTVTTGRFLLSLAGRYERLLEDQTIPDTMIVITKGDIAAFQAKLVIPIKGTAFKIPISISFANRTELLKEREIRGNFGFTFDIDSILARFNPFTVR